MLITVWILVKAAPFSGLEWNESSRKEVNNAFELSGGLFFIFLISDWVELYDMYYYIKCVFGSWLLASLLLFFSLLFTGPMWVLTYFI